MADVVEAPFEPGGGNLAPDEADFYRVYGDGTSEARGSSWSNSSQASPSVEMSPGDPPVAPARKPRVGDVRQTDSGRYMRYTGKRWTRKCYTVACSRQPSFGVAWMKPIHCKEHRAPDEVDVVNKRCQDPECDVISPAKPFCAKHRRVTPADEAAAVEVMAPRTRPVRRMRVKDPHSWDDSDGGDRETAAKRPPATDATDAPLDRQSRPGDKRAAVAPDPDGGARDEAGTLAPPAKRPKPEAAARGGVVANAGVVLPHQLSRKRPSTSSAARIMLTFAQTRTDESNAPGALPIMRLAPLPHPPFASADGSVFVGPTVPVAAGPGNPRGVAKKGKRKDKGRRKAKAAGAGSDGSGESGDVGAVPGPPPQRNDERFNAKTGKWYRFTGTKWIYKCAQPGCLKMPSFGTVWMAPVHCRTHMQAGETNVRRTNCSFDGCPNLATRRGACKRHFKLLGPKEGGPKEGGANDAPAAAVAAVAAVAAAAPGTL